MMISDDADEHTERASVQDPDSDSEAIILLSNQMVKSTEVKEDLKMDFEDEELALHNRARDVHVTIDQFMMLPQTSQNASALILRFVRERALFTETLAQSFLEAYVDPYHPPFPLFSDIGLWHLRAGSVADPGIEVPDRYAGVSEYDVLLAHQCVLIVLEAQVRAPTGLKKENFLLTYPQISDSESQDLLVLASAHPALAGILFALNALLPMYNCLTDITDPTKDKPQGKCLLAGSDDDKIHSCMLYVIHQLVSCARKIKTGIVNKKGAGERYRYKALPVWNCPTFCRLVWGGLANAFYTATATFYNDPDTFQSLPDYFENLTCDIARDRPGMIAHFLTPSIQRAAHGESLEDEVVEYTGDWELDRMEFSKALARDSTYAETDLDSANIVGQNAELFVYEKWCDKSVGVQNPTVRVFNRGDTPDQLASAYSRIDVAVTSAQLENQLCALDDLFGNEVSEEVTLLRLAMGSKSSMYVTASDDKTIAGDLAKEAGDSDPSMLQPHSSSADSAVSASSIKKPLRKKPINKEDGDEGDQDISPSSKRHKSTGEELPRVRTAKTKKSGLADSLQGDALLQFRASDGSRDPSLASQEGNQFKITMENSVRDLKEQVTDKFSALTSEVTRLREGLAKESKRSDTAIANETAKVLELTTRVLKQSDDIAKLNRRVALLEDEIKNRAR